MVGNNSFVRSCQITGNKNSKSVCDFDKKAPIAVPRRQGISWKVGEFLKVRDRSQWYNAKIININWKSHSVKIHFQNWNSRYDSWLSMNSEDIKSSKILKPCVKKIYKHFTVGQKIHAKWKDGNMRKATIKKCLGADKYIVLFEKSGVQCRKHAADVQDIRAKVVRNVTKRDSNKSVRILSERLTIEKKCDFKCTFIGCAKRFQEEKMLIYHVKCHRKNKDSNISAIAKGKTLRESIVCKKPSNNKTATLIKQQKICTQLKSFGKQNFLKNVAKSKNSVIKDLTTGSETSNLNLGTKLSSKYNNCDLLSSQSFSFAQSRTESSIFNRNCFARKVSLPAKFADSEIYLTSPLIMQMHKASSRRSFTKRKLNSYSEQNKTNKSLKTYKLKEINSPGNQEISLNSIKKSFPAKKKSFAVNLEKYQKLKYSNKNSQYHKPQTLMKVKNRIKQKSLKNNDVEQLYVKKQLLNYNLSNQEAEELYLERKKIIELKTGILDSRYDSDSFDDNGIRNMEIHQSGSKYSVSKGLEVGTSEQKMAPVQKSSAVSKRLKTKHREGLCALHNRCKTKNCSWMKKSKHNRLQSKKSLYNQAQASHNVSQVVYPETDDVIACVCDSTADEGKMVQCDFCKTWQHFICLNIKNIGEDEEHMCWNCRYTRGIRETKDKFYLKWLAQKESVPKYPSKIHLLQDEKVKNSKSVVQTSEFDDSVSTFCELLLKYKEMLEVFNRSSQNSNRNFRNMALNAKLSEDAFPKITKIIPVSLYCVYFLDILINDFFIYSYASDLLTLEEVQILISLRSDIAIFLKDIANNSAEKKVKNSVKSAHFLQAHPELISILDKVRALSKIRTHDQKLCESVASNLSLKSNVTVKLESSENFSEVLQNVRSRNCSEIEMALSCMGEISQHEGSIVMEDDLHYRFLGLLIMKKVINGKPKNLVIGCGVVIVKVESTSPLSFLLGAENLERIQSILEELNANYNKYCSHEVKKELFHAICNINVELKSLFSETNFPDCLEQLPFDEKACMPSYLTYSNIEKIRSIIKNLQLFMK